MYAKHTTPPREEIVYLLELVASKLTFQQNETILDIGCGPGNVTALALKNYLPQDASIVGVDVSEKMVKYAQSKYGNDKLSFKLLDIGNSNIWMNWNEESIDKVYSFYCLHYMRDLKQVVENIAMLLKKGGDLVTLSMKCSPMFKLFGKLHQDPKYSNQKKVMTTYEGMFRDFDDQLFINALQASGFQITSNFDMEIVHMFTSIAEFSGMTILSMQAPTAYAKHTAPLRQEIAVFLQDVAPKLKFQECERVLDIGCGPGDVTACELFNSLPHDTSIIGADISEKMIDYGRANYGNDKISFKLLDVGSCSIWANWKEESFDKIYSFYCLHWIKDIKQAVENISLLLKENGDLLTLLIKRTPYFALFRKLYDDPKFAKHKKVMKSFEAIFSNFDEEQYIQSLEKCGFRIVSYSLKEIHQRFPTVKEFAEFTDSLNPFMRNVSGSETKACSEYVVNIALESGLFKVADDGSVTQSLTVIEVHGIKIALA